METISLQCKKLLDAREDYKITQEKAAQLLGVSHKTYWGYENGKQELKPWQIRGIIEEFKLNERN